jgi:hypothetical protein
MNDHRAIVDQYLRTEFPDASIVDHDDTGQRGRWWSIKHRGAVMVLRVTQEFLTAHAEDEAQAWLERLAPARALRESAGRVVVLSRHGLRYVPAIPT